MRGLLLRTLLTLTAAAATAAAAAAEETPRLAVIVHGGVPLSDLSLAELRKVFLGDRQFWTGDLRIVVLVPPAGSPERAQMLEKVYEKTETQYRHYWIAKVFREEAQSAPKRVESSRSAGELVRQIPGAVSVVDAARVPAGVKVLRVDGKAPSDDGYPLR
jgi:ABC-type phosphate transport system substrate-binding protein